MGRLGVGDEHRPMVGGELALPAGHGDRLGVLDPDMVLDGGLMGMGQLGLIIIIPSMQLHAI